VSLWGDLSYTVLEILSEKRHVKKATAIFSSPILCWSLVRSPMAQFEIGFRLEETTASAVTEDNLLRLGTR